VWEKSRFTYLLMVIRNDYHCDEDHSQFIFDEIESWINANLLIKAQIGNAAMDGCELKSTVFLKDLICCEKVKKSFIHSQSLVVLK
jgi:hypothetical protein